MSILSIILIHSLLAIVLGWIYFHRYAVKRPPIGVLNLWDIGLMMGGILLVPYLYLALPTWMVTGLIGLAAISTLYFSLEPVFTKRWMVWQIVLLLVWADLKIFADFGFESQEFFTVNNVIQILVIVGITNLWAQSGMRARDVAILGGLLTVYDYTFTTLLPLMNNLFTQLNGLPLAPMVAWTLGNGQTGAIGMGDLLLATVFPLVMRKGYGKTAGWVALAGSGATLAGVMLLLVLGMWGEAFPVMIALGPVMVIQYVFWRWRSGGERTTRQYLQKIPTSFDIAQQISG